MPKTNSEERKNVIGDNLKELKENLKELNSSMPLKPKMTPQEVDKTEKTKKSSMKKALLFFAVAALLLMATIFSGGAATIALGGTIAAALGAMGGLNAYNAYSAHQKLEDDKAYGMNAEQMAQMEIAKTEIISKSMGKMDAQLNESIARELEKTSGKSDAKEQDSKPATEEELISSTASTAERKSQERTRPGKAMTGFNVSTPPVRKQGMSM